MRLQASSRPLQQDHCSQLPASGACSQRETAAQLCRARWHVVGHVGHRRRRQAVSSGRNTTTAAAAAGAATPEARPGEQHQQLVLRSTPGGSRAALLDPSLAADDGDIVNFFFRQYNLSARKQVRGKADRALAALRTAEPGADALSLQRDVLPKLEMLEALHPGLGWKVFRRYPEQFASPDAVESWCLVAALLYTEVGLQPDEITALFARHQPLFKQAVLQPDNLRRLFVWLRQDLGLDQRGVLKLVNRCPLVLQTDVEGVLKPRVQWLVDLGMPQERIVTGIMRAPEVLGVDSALLQAKAAYLQSPSTYSPQGSSPLQGGGGPGLSGLDVAALFVRDPASLLASLTRLRETVDWLRDGLGLDAPLLRKVVAKGGACKYPLTTLHQRAAFWTDPPPGGQGFSPAQLHTLLDRLPRLLLYPLREPKYQAKMRFLEEELGLPPEALLAFPAYLTYSLPGRTAPRAAAARALAGQALPLQQLATGEEAFIRWLRVTPEEYYAWEAGWKAGPEAQRWAAPAGGQDGEQAAGEER